MRRHEHIGAVSPSGLMAIGWAVLGGLALGFVCAYALRLRGLRWTWSLLGAPAAYGLWMVDWRAGLTATAATATAVYVGAHEHAETLRHGGEEARTTRENAGPIQTLRSRYAAWRVPDNRLSEDGLALGMNRSGAVCRIPIADGTGVHGLVVGATGAGKTVTQAAIAQAYIRAGKAVIVIDPKGDHDLITTLKQTSAEMGVRIQGWTPEGPTTYNPLGRGKPTEVADKALAAHEWTEPHYELATQRLVQQALKVMLATREWPPTLSSLVAYLDTRHLGDLAEDIGGRLGEEVLSYLGCLTSRGQEDLGGGRDRLAVLIESELGQWLAPQPGKQELDLAGALERREVIYFYLDADRYPAAAKLLASALLSDMVSLMAERPGAGGLIAIDEFAALAAPQVSRLLARARYAGLSMLLGTQSLADLRAVRLGHGIDILTEQVFANVGFTVAHRVADPDSAERLARLAGTTPSWTLTQRVSTRDIGFGTREGTRTREREFVLGPDQFKRLGVGEAVVIDPKATPPAQVVQIWGDQGAAQ